MTSQTIHRTQDFGNPQMADTTANTSNLDDLVRPSDIDINSDLDINVDRDDREDDDRSATDADDGGDDDDDDDGARRPQPAISRMFEGLFRKDGAMVFVKKGISLTLSRAGSDGDGMPLYKVTELRALDVREPRPGNEGA